MRITAQLVDAATGSHLWTDRFDGDVMPMAKFVEGMRRAGAPEQ